MEKNKKQPKKQIKQNKEKKKNDKTTKKKISSLLAPKGTERYVRKTSAKKTTNKIIKKQKGGTNIGTAAVNTVKSMIDLGKNIGNEIDALMNMGRDFNRATNVKLPNQTTPDQNVINTTGSFKNPTYPKAKV